MGTAAGLIQRVNGAGLDPTHYLGNGVNVGGSGSGSWGLFDDANMIGQGTSGATRGGYSTGISGDYIWDTVPDNAEAVYAILRVSSGNAGASTSNNTTFFYQTGDTNTNTVVDQKGVFSVDLDAYSFVSAVTKYYVPLSRFGADDWSSGTRQVRLVQGSNSVASFQPDGFLYVTSKASAPWVENGLGELVPNGLFGLGDSWTKRGGSSHLESSYLRKLFRMLLRHYKANITQMPYVNSGVDGDMLVGTSGNVSRTGGMYRYVNSYLSNPMSIFTCLFGPNDLANFSVGGYAEMYENFLCLIEDTLVLNDPLGARVVLGTPGWRSIIAMTAAKGLSDPTATGQLGNQYGSIKISYKEAVDAVRFLTELFDYIRVADIYDCLNHKNELLYTNASQPVDFGNHPNNMGCYKIAQRLMYAIIANAIELSVRGRNL